MKRNMSGILALMAMAGTLSAQTVLIASENTTYKKKLAEAITAVLESEGVALELVEEIMALVREKL